MRALREVGLRPRGLMAVNLAFIGAMLCHAVAVWSVFALVLLAWKVAGANLRYFARVAGLNCLLAAAVLGGVIWLFLGWLTPDVGWAHVGRRAFLLSGSAMLAHRPPAAHLLALLRVATPALVVLVACGLGRRARA